MASLTADGAQLNGSVNGGERYVDSIDPDDPERAKELMKPPEVKEDMKQMEARARVSQILNSQAFREELEEIIESQLKTGIHPASLIALQQISQLILPHMSPAASGLQGAISAGRAPIIPVADIKGVNSTLYSKGERILRCKLASLYRLIDLFGWTYSIYNHITVRISQGQEHFLINPFGLMYSEVTAGSLIKVDMQGNVVDPGNTSLGVNKAGFILHSAIHAARPDIRCIIHVHASAAVAVSVMKCGLLPITREALLLGEVTYHSYQGILVDDAERELIARDLGPSSKVMFLRNHGLVACGITIEEALYYFYNAMLACEAQVRVASLGLDNIVLISDTTKQLPVSTGAESLTNGSGTDATNGQTTSGRKWKRGELEFEAWMRLLDNAGYRTGYIYRQPVLRNERRDKLTSDIEYPPATSALQYYDDADKSNSPLKEVHDRQKKQQKTEWLNTPNVYKKEEIAEVGTPNPKKITKWVPDADGKQATPVKLLNANQFAPQGVNPKEFKEAQKQIKEVYYKDLVSAGPQSRILEGATWDDAKLAQDAGKSITGDAVIVVGAASKGIIKKDHQHNAVVFRQPYGANPFGSMTDEALEQYKKDVEKKSTVPGTMTSSMGGDLSQDEPVLAMESSVTDAEPDADVAKNHDSDAEAWQHPSQSKETSVDDLVGPDAVGAAEPVSSSANTPSTQDTPVSAPSSNNFRRTASERYPEKSPALVDELKSRSNFERSKSDRKPTKAAKSVTSGEALASGTESKTPDVQSGAESAGETAVQDSPSKGKDDDKKKKKKFRMPSFSKKKEEKKDEKREKKPKHQTAV